jgi:hypothetical protein
MFYVWVGDQKLPPVAKGEPIMLGQLQWAAN